MSLIKVKFPNTGGKKLSGTIEFPIDRKPYGYVVFAHVFTGHKNLKGTRYVSKALVKNGFAVLRFDFTGLGDSEGDFSKTNFSSNIEDIISASEFLAKNYDSPSLIVGQSLGGAASVFASARIESVKAVATIGTPSTPEHVMHLFGSSTEEIEKYGEADIEISGRAFTIRKQFLEDLRSKDMYSILRNLRKGLLIMHSPQDRIVAIEHAAKLYHAAFHPKSFITLDNADHLLSNNEDALYAGELIASWVKRYIDIPEEETLTTDKQVVARLGYDGYTTEMMAGKHRMIADEPKSVGGNNFGPTPYQLLGSALAACKAMTLQMYARRKKWDLEEVEVHVSFERSYAEDCANCEDSSKKLEFFHTELQLEGDLDEKQKKRLMEIAGKCPVHKTLAGNPEFRTKLKAD